MTYKELGEKVAEQALDNYLINGKTMREWINILSDNMSMLDKIRDEILALPRELPTDARNMVRRTRVLDIIDKYTKGGKE